MDMRKGLGIIITVFFASTQAIPAWAAAIDASRLPTTKTLPWQDPGIQGGIPTVTSKCVTAACQALEAGSYSDALTAIQSAIDSAPDGTYVHIPAGTYDLSGSISIIRSNVVVRGDGPDKTKLVHNLSGPTDGVIAVGSGAGGWVITGLPRTLATGGITKGSTSITVTDASSFKPGEIVTIEQLDTAPSGQANPLVVTGDCVWDKVVDSPGDEGTARSLAQMLEVVSISGNTLNTATPLYMDFSATYGAEVVHSGRVDSNDGSSNGMFRNVGIEDLSVANGNDGGNIEIICGYKCWVRNVESANVLGRHIDLVSCYRCVVRDCYIHDSQNYGSGGSAYGITMTSYTTDCLVENNISLHLNFPILFEASGGGNVVGYNYVDHTNLLDYEGDEKWLMPGIGTHCSFPHMELLEGNWASQINYDKVHGGSAYIMSFRNYIRGQNSPSTVYPTTIKTQNLIAYNDYAENPYMSVVGSVLWRPGDLTYTDNNGATVPFPYQDCGSGVPAVFNLGSDYIPDPLTDLPCDPMEANTIFRHGNFDYVSNAVAWDSGFEHTLPDSLYLPGKPAFFGSRAWPFVDPVNRSGEAMVGTLPAKACYDNRTFISPAACLAGSGQATLSVQPSETREGDTGTATLTFDVNRTD
jgi:hypothetical protein